MTRAGRTLAALAALYVLAAAGPARADNDEYGERVAEARRLLQSGDRRGAIRAFERAYEAQPRPELLYNIGVTYKKLATDSAAPPSESAEDAQRAIDAFQQYLERYREAKGVDPPDRRTVERNVSAMREQLAKSQAAWKAAQQSAPPPPAPASPTPTTTPTSTPTPTPTTTPTSTPSTTPTSTSSTTPTSASTPSSTPAIASPSATTPASTEVRAKVPTTRPGANGARPSGPSDPDDPAFAPSLANVPPAPPHRRRPVAQLATGGFVFALGVGAFGAGAGMWIEGGRAPQIGGESLGDYLLRLEGYRDIAKGLFAGGAVGVAIAIVAFAVPPRADKPHALRVVPTPGGLLVSGSF